MRPRNENTSTAGCRSFVPATLMPRDRHAATSTSVSRYSHASYMSGTTHVGFSCPTISASIGRTWPLLVTMSAAPITPGSFFSDSVILSATPAIRASSRVTRSSSRAVAYLVGAARACTVPPAMAARTGVTAYGPVAASVRMTNPVRSRRHRLMAAPISRARRRGSRPGSSVTLMRRSTSLCVAAQAFRAAWSPHCRRGAPARLA